MRNDRVIERGPSDHGPIIHRLQLDQVANGRYPVEFGGEQLFEQNQIADVVSDPLET